VIQALNAGADLECIDQYGYPGLPLRTACFLGHKEIVTELLRRGADGDAANSDGPGAPLRMATRGKRDEIMAILRQHALDFPAKPSPAMKKVPETPTPAATNNTPENTPPQAGTPTPDTGVESFVISGCYGVDTNVLEGDLLRQSLEEDKNGNKTPDETKGDSGESMANKLKFWQRR
jgi:ankyrin repeat protein